MLDVLYVKGGVDIHLLVKDVINNIFGYINEYSGVIELYERQYLTIERSVEAILEERTQPLVGFDDYQKKASTTALYYNSIDKMFEGLPSGARKLLGLSYVALGLGESGEVQGKIKKIIRDSGGVINAEVKKAIGKELGDQLWYISQVCEELGLHLSDVANENIEKLYSRKERGVITGSGDDR